MEYPIFTLTSLPCDLSDCTIHVVGDAAALGSAPDSDILLDDPRVSPRHAILTFISGVCTLQDLGSAWGTYVNGRRVQIAPLRAGDLLAIGGSVWRVGVG
jgi:pSer/pThr/pTyr-binding forkhead associated (FHA) protein